MEICCRAVFLWQLRILNRHRWQLQAHRMAVKASITGRSGTRSPRSPNRWAAKLRVSSSRCCFARHSGSRRSFRLSLPPTWCQANRAPQCRRRPSPQRSHRRPPPNAPWWSVWAQTSRSSASYTARWTWQSSASCSASLPGRERSATANSLLTTLLSHATHSTRVIFHMSSTD